MAGLYGLYIVHDDYERTLNLPSGAYDTPLMIRAIGLNNDGTLSYTPSITKEFYGNAITNNGKLWPYLEVESRKYRFRVLNASNARSLELKIVAFEDPKISGPTFLQIGSDAGFLPAPVVVGDPSQSRAPRLTLAPSERADVIVDFSKFAGRELLLHNSHLGDDPAGQLPLTHVMKFRVKARGAADSSTAPTKLRSIQKIRPREARLTRKIVIGHMEMDNDEPMLQLNGASWLDPITEKPRVGSTEIWEIINTEQETYPFHVHLVDFQVLDRTPFNVEEYLNSGTIALSGPSREPELNEAGRKDTVRAKAGEITRIIMRFAPYAGYYVYNSGILEHEDMDMMRPFQVVGR